MKLWNQPFELTGETVSLIPMNENQTLELWEAAKPEEIWEFSAGKVRSIEAAYKMVEVALMDREKGSSYPFVVKDIKSEQIIGSTRFLDISPAHKTVEIGWTWYNPRFWRTRVNTECKFLLLEHAFDVWDMNRVQLKTDLRNVRSQAAIARIGGVKEGVLRKERIIDDGYVRDTVIYSILKEEWPDVRISLLKKLGVE